MPSILQGPTGTTALNPPVLHLPSPKADPVPYLARTKCFDLEHPLLVEFVHQASAGTTTLRERAAALFYAVRDPIRHDPHGLVFEPAAHRASAVIAAGPADTSAQAGDRDDRFQ